jgi:hypothetical protein
MTWIRRLLQRSSTFKPKPNSNTKSSRTFSNTVKMSAASTSAALYASVISASQFTGTVPEDAAELKHHLKNGKGFRNPWDSFVDPVGPKIIWTLLMYWGGLSLVLYFDSSANSRTTDDA